MSSINFTLFNPVSNNTISGITYLAKPSKNDNVIDNPTPYHIFLGHATGFCKEVYTDLVKELRKLGVDYPVTAIDMINHGDSTHDLPTADWVLCANDVYAVIEKIIRPRDPNKTLIGMGHSMGGTVCSLVESAHPGFFDCLMTMRRKSQFPNKQAIYEAFSSKPPFNSWTKGSLDAYINHGFKQTIKDGKEIMELKIVKEQEAEFYRNGAAHGAHDLITKLQVPILIVRGTESTFTREFYKPIVARSFNTVQIDVEGSHFFPMEHPVKVADVAWQFVKRHVVRSKL